jgi:prolyl oligopeptidase
MVGGRARLLRRPWSDSSGAKPASVELPFDGWIDDLVTDPLADGATITLQGWTRPATIYAYDTRTARLVATGLGSTTNADVSILMAEEVEAKSADGTLVPLSILRRKYAKLDGSHPTIDYGYGGYGISQTPNFRADRMAWIERGGIFAVCHVRGGGEKGYHWQEDGSHERKMNGIHDLEACGDYLVEHGYTSRSRLAAQGGSMGGILVGRAITDRPDLFAAAHVAVGAVNPLRTLAAENGANQKVELGDPETEAGFRSIFEMDPYLHVKPGTSYPATIFTVGLNDKRVAPWMTGKMAAAMQAAKANGKPVLVRIDDDAGHGVGSTRDQLFAERADAYAFLLAAMGDPDFQPAAETARR